jgi:hypothetical protein
VHRAVLAVSPYIRSCSGFFSGNIWSGSRPVRIDNFISDDTAFTDQVVFGIS